MGVKKTHEINLNSILGELGSFGKFQVTNLLLMIVPLALTSMFTLSYIFTASDLNYRCKVKECDNDNYTSSVYLPNWIVNAVPFKDGKPAQCERFGFIDGGSGCSAKSFDQNVTEICDEFVYESDEKTILNEWNLTCNENKWKLSLVGTINVVGTFFCLPITGIVSDLYGRRFTFVVGMMACAIFGVLRSFSWSYMSFLSFEFLDSLLGSSTFLSGYILALEWFGPQHRLLAATLISFCYSVGRVGYGVMAMYALNWRNLLRIAYSPAFIFISYIWLIPESVLWLHTQGQTEKVISILKRVAHVNKVVLSEVHFGESESFQIESNDKNVMDKGSEDHGLTEIFKYPSMIIRIAAAGVCWFTITFVYYGLSLTSVTIAGNKFTNFIFTTASELPGFILFYYLNNNIGRKHTLAWSFIASGAACIAFIFTSHSYLWSFMLIIIGKCAITVSFSTLYIYSTELFPTSMRHSLLAICSSVGRIGNMISPQLILLGVFVKHLPMILLGSFGFISGLLAFTFPETLNRPLPDTLEEASRMGQSEKKYVDK